MKPCTICGKRIEDVKVLVHGVIWDMDVCGDCLKPYIKPLPEGEKPKIGKIVYERPKAKKKKRK